MLVIGIVCMFWLWLNKRVGLSIVCNLFGLVRLEIEIFKLYGYDFNILNEKFYCDIEIGEGVFYCSSIKKCCNIVSVIKSLIFNCIFYVL